jgi:hypothetical protein
VSSLDDLIKFDLPEDWALTISRSETATIIKENTHSPIPAFDLGIQTTAPYVAIVVQTTQGKVTWKYGGELRQAWSFPSGAAIGGALNVAQSKENALFLNKVQLVKLNPNSLQPCRLRYLPPYWFKDVIIFGWEYRGTIENFVKDTLFDIGNKVGIGTLNLPDNIPNTLESIKQKLNYLEFLISNSPSPDGSNPDNDITPKDFEDYNNLGLL